MSAPQRTAGGRTKAQTEVPSQIEARGRAAKIRAASEGLEPSARPPRHDTSRSARPKILEAARHLAKLKGYEPLRVMDITKEAGISHQSFYGHFANKRHAVAIATSTELGAIADLAMRGSRQDEAWAKRLLEDIDTALIEAYPATDGPEMRLRNLLTEAICTKDGYDALRIAEMIKVSRLGHGEFYRRYGGKRGCLRRIYAEVLAELRGELPPNVESESPIGAIAEAFASDPTRAKLLVLAASHLPEEAKRQEPGDVSQRSLQGLLADVLIESSPLDPLLAETLAAGVYEVVRSSVVAGRVEELPADLELLGRAWSARITEAGEGELAA